jgi:hypothetical protein
MPLPAVGGDAVVFEDEAEQAGWRSMLAVAKDLGEERTPCATPVVITTLHQHSR